LKGLERLGSYGETSIRMSLGGNDIHEVGMEDDLEERMFPQVNLRMSIKETLEAYL
jgi:hypothetical protein